MADLRYVRDVKKGVVEAIDQQGYRRGADRKDLHSLLNWSERRDFAIETAPGKFKDVTPARAA